MKRKWWLAAILTLAAVFGLTFAITALLPPKPGVTRANFDRIEKGMTREQVEAILGQPTKDRLWRVVLPEWSNDSGDEAWIVFDENQRVESMTWDGWPDDRTLYEKLRDWLPWRKREPRMRERLIL